MLDEALVSAPLVTKPPIQRRDSCSSYSASGSSSSDSQSSDCDSDASHKSSSSQSYKSEQQQQGKEEEHVEMSTSRRSVLGLRTRPPKRKLCIQSSESEEDEVSDKQSNDGSDYVMSQSEKSEDDLEEDSVSGSESAESIWSDEYLPKKKTTTRRAKKRPTKVAFIVMELFATP